MFSSERRSISCMRAPRSTLSLPVRITSEEGCRLRMNRSIQAEGSFANVKEDMGFRRYAYRGIENVTAQSVILAIAHNVNKYHNKIQSDKTGRHLFDLKESA